MQMETEEEQRLLKEQSDSIALDEEPDHDENTEWLRGREWPIWFAKIATASHYCCRLLTIT